MKIDEIRLEVILDSRGKDTIKVTLKSGNLYCWGSVPSGKSVGATEAAVVAAQKVLEKEDWLNSQIKGIEFATLEEFDGFFINLDATPNKQNLGGNLTLGLSLAFTRLLAHSSGMELFEMISRISGNRPRMPYCFYNLIEGGMHAENSLPFQEYLFVPQTASAKVSLQTVNKTIDLLKAKIMQQYGRLLQGDEGGFAIPSQDPEAGLKILQGLISQNNLNSKIGLDAAASAFHQDKSYLVGDKKMTTDQLLSLYRQLSVDYSLLSIEDPFDQEDWQGFSNLQSRIGSSVWIIGDDLLTTNVGRIKKAFDKQAVNAVLIKPNQIGTITETIQAVNLAKSYGWKIIVSHRSGETMDTFIADLAVGVGADGLKSGNPLQKERLVKYQRLVEIEKKIN